MLFSLFRLSVHLCKLDWYRKGLDLRRVIVVGSRTLARHLIDRIRSQPEIEELGGRHPAVAGEHEDRESHRDGDGRHDRREHHVLLIHRRDNRISQRTAGKEEAGAEECQEKGDRVHEGGPAKTPGCVPEDVARARPSRPLRGSF